MVEPTEFDSKLALEGFLINELGLNFRDPALQKIVTDIIKEQFPELRVDNINVLRDEARSGFFSPSRAAELGRSSLTQEELAAAQALVETLDEALRVIGPQLEAEDRRRQDRTAANIFSELDLGSMPEEDRAALKQGITQSVLSGASRQDILASIAESAPELVPSETEAGPAQGSLSLVPVPGVPGKSYWVDANGDPIIDISTGVPKLYNTGSGGGTTRTEFASERDLRLAQADTLQRGTAVDEARESRLGGEFQQTEERLLQELGISEDLGRGRLDLDTELGRGRLSLDRELGFGNLGLDTALGLGNLGLDQSEFVANILRNPSDTLARFFFQRGGGSPAPFISQADLINQLRTEFESSLRLGQDVQAQGAPAPRLAPQVAPQEQAPSRLEGIPSIEQIASLPIGESVTNVAGKRFTNFGAEQGQLSRITQEQFDETPDFVKKFIGIPGFEHGGTTTSRLMLVGEEGPELVANPEGAHIGVLDAKKTKKVSKTGAKRLQGGTLASFGGLSRLLTQGPVDQQSLIDLSRTATPPGPAAALAGDPIPAFRTGAPIPTKIALSKLSSDELESLRPRLATEFNATLEDLLFEVGNRFEGQRVRPRARLAL